VTARLCKYALSSLYPKNEFVVGPVLQVDVDSQYVDYQYVDSQYVDSQYVNSQYVDYQYVDSQHVDRQLLMLQDVNTTEG
jgi:hypothetical protein